MTDICARAGCENPLKTGKKYCSTDCANKANAVIKKEVSLDSAPAKEVNAVVEVIRGGRVPRQIENMLIDGIGHSGANVILEELEFQLASDANGTDEELGMTLSVWPEWMRKQYPIDGGFGIASGLVSVPRPSLKPPTAASIEPNAVLRSSYSTSGFVSDIRRDDVVSFQDIDRLMKLGPYVFASRIKKGPIMSALSGKRKWTVDCDNEKLKKVIEADLEKVFMRYVADILTSLDYGVAFGSVMWEKKSASDIGVGKGVGRESSWYVVDKIQWAHPSSVKEIVRDENTSAFAGYTHWRRYREPRTVVIDPMQALVITYGGLFGNMWGQSMGEAIYDFAFWYEVLMRSFLRYMQRMATPVCVVYGPNRGTSKRPDGSRISNPEYGLLLAGAAASSSGIYLPSELDLQTGQPLWRMEYLTADSKGDQYISGLQYLGTQITRGLLIGDRAATQEGDRGGYNVGAIHNAMTQIDNDYIFKDILGQLNPYLVHRYGMFNVSYNDPPRALLTAEVIDPLEQEMLMKLFATAGNTKFGEGTPLDQVNWEEAFKSIHVPVLTDEEFDKKYEENLERKGEAQQQSMDLQAEAMAKAAKASGGPPQNNGSQPRQPQSAGDKSRLSVLEHLADGGTIPVMMTPETVRELLLPRSEGSLELTFIEGGAKLGPADDSVQLGVLEWLKDKAADTAEFISRAAGGGGKIGEAASKIAEELREGEETDEDFERKHPRDESGRFAKKGETGPGKTAEAAVDMIKQALKVADPAEYGSFMANRALADGRITLAQHDGLVAMANDIGSGDPWPNPSKDKGIHGRWEFDGITYDGLGGVSGHSMIGLTLNAMTTVNRTREMGHEPLVSKFAFVGKGYDEAAGKYWAKEVRNLGPLGVNTNAGDIMRANRGFLGVQAQESRLLGEGPHVIMVDSGLVDNLRFDLDETRTAHEVLHSNRRFGDLERAYSASKQIARYEEGINTILQREYADRYESASPSLFGYHDEVREIVGYARDLGWSKAKLYQFARSIHKIDGDQYASLVSQLRSAAESYSGSKSWSDDWLEEWFEESNEAHKGLWDIYP